MRREANALPPLAALFTTDGYRVPGAELAPPMPDALGQWELPLGDDRAYGLNSASGQIRIVPPAY
jgi:hypothetical protein